MKMVKDISLVALGAVSALLIDKYSKPIIKAMKRKMQKAVKTTYHEIDDLLD